MCNLTKNEKKKIVDFFPTNTSDMQVCLITALIVKDTKEKTIRL